MHNTKKSTFQGHKKQETRTQTRNKKQILRYKDFVICNLNFVCVLVSLCFVSLMLFLSIHSVSADLWDQQGDMMIGTDKIGGAFGEVDEPGDVRDTAVLIAKVFISFLALIFTLVIMWGGYTWMTSEGNQDKTVNAKKWLTRGVVGMVIVLAAFLIVTWVFSTTNTLIKK